MQNEIWKDIPGYEGCYQVSNTGRVKSLPRGKMKYGCIRRQRIKRNGYKGVNLCKDGKITHLLVHRLVAMTFIPNPENLPYVNHKDEIKSNNNVDNLEWCTHIYNCNYGTGIKRQIKVRKTNPNNKNSYNRMRLTRIERKRKCMEIRVFLMDSDGSKVMEFASMSEASRHTGICISDISACCKGKISQCKGTYWRFADDELNDKAQRFKIDRIKKGKQSHAIKVSAAVSKQVIQYTKDGVFVAEYKSIKSAAEALNGSPVYIGKVCNGKFSSAYGFVWKFKSTK